MPIEHEAKILDIDPDAITRRILDAGGTRTSGTRLMRRYVYDIVPGDMSRWIRLRDTGSEATLCVKEIRDDTIGGTHEVETPVGDFAAAHEILAALGYKPKSYQENRRTSFTLGDVQVELDEWPGIPPYLEIEGTSKDAVAAAAALLGYSEDQLTGENTIKVYARYGISLPGIRELKFPD